jgi:uncharacterized damage-inducible protein DinB
MKKYFLKLYQYNAWANERVLSCLQKQQVNHEKVLSLLGHILVAQNLWLNRIIGQPPPLMKLWGEYKLEELQEMAVSINKRWLDFVGSEGNFDRELDYKNYTGDPYKNNVEMIMIHVVNHGSYHRAQIAMLLRQNGLEPVNTDFITFDRVITGQWKD